MNGFEQEVIDRLARIETKMETCTVDHETVEKHEARLVKIEARDSASTKWIDAIRTAAISGGVSGIVALLVYWATNR